MTWKAVSEEPLGWCVWNGAMYHTTHYGDVVIGTRESMENLAGWLNREAEVRVRQASAAPSDRAAAG